MTDRIAETFSAAQGYVDAIVTPSELLGVRSLAVFAALAGVIGLADSENVAIAECGVADGTTAAGINQILKASGLELTPLFLFDTFGTVPIAARNNLAAQVVDTHARSVEKVSDVVGPGPVHYEVGLFSDTLKTFTHPLAFLHADGDLYESTCNIIAMAERCVVREGVVVFDDYGSEWTGVTRAVHEKLSKHLWFTYVVQGTAQLVAVRRA